MLFDFRDGPDKFLHLADDFFVGDHQVRHDQNVADAARIQPQSFGQRQNFADDQRRAGERLAHRGLPALDAFRQLDFAFTRQQRHRAHFAQVHAYRIVGLVAEIL